MAKLTPRTTSGSTPLSVNEVHNAVIFIPPQVGEMKAMWSDSVTRMPVVGQKVRLVCMDGSRLVFFGEVSHAYKTGAYYVLIDRVEHLPD